MPVDIARLADPGKLDIKRREPGILFQFTKLIPLQTSNYDVMVDLVSIQRHWRRIQ